MLSESGVVAGKFRRRRRRRNLLFCPSVDGKQHSEIDEGRVVDGTVNDLSRILAKRLDKEGT